MIKINKFILIICFLVLLLMFIICKNDILNIFNNIFNNDIFNNNKLRGGNTENIGDIQSQIRNDEEEIKRMKNELESLRRNRRMDIGNIYENNKNTDDNMSNTQNFGSNLFAKERNNKNLILTQDSNSNYIKLKRDILEDTNVNATENIINNDTRYQDDNDTYETIDDENEEENERVVEKITKPYEDMCEKYYNKKKKKSKYMDLKLDLNESINLEPFNNDDFGEYGQFNC